MSTSLSSKVALSLLAHPDDAEILCGGTLIRLRDQGWTIHIATATPGDCGTMTESRWDISSIRIAEAKKAAAMIGATYHCLDERDGMVVYEKGTSQKTIDLFRRVAPTLVFTHAPKDYMLDHEQTHLLARAASFVYGAPNISAFPLLTGSRIPYLYYCDPVEGIDPLGNEVQPTTCIDISAVIEKKAEMLGCHASQREWLAAHHGMDEYIEAMKRHARHRGGQAGTAYAEAFVQHRGHAYPHDDLLLQLLGKVGVNPCPGDQALSPSPGTPGDGWGEGLVPDADRRPSPPPSPGVPGEGVTFSPESSATPGKEATWPKH